MIHARPDYQRIQDPAGLIPEDEPVFLLRGRDKFAPWTVRLWAECAHQNGAAPDIVKAAYDHARRMEEWQKVHGNQIPDLPASLSK